MRGWRRFAAALCAGAFLSVPAAHALDRITAGAVGSPTGTMWPYFIAMDKGFLTEAGVELDLVYAPTAPGILQQLAAGSLDIVATTGLPEPIHAVDKGAPVAVVRILGQVPPYVILAKPTIATIGDLKGKTVALGGLADINMIYFERVLAGNGLKPGDCDIVVIGATGARLSALQSGAVDATMLVPPFSFRGEEAGFRNLALVMDYAKDLPFTGIEVSVPWASTHGAEIRHFLGAVDRAVAWFDDEANRQEAIGIFSRYAKQDAKDAAESYDFFRKIDFFARTDAVSRAQLRALVKDMQATGDVGPTMTVDRLALPGLTRLVE